MDGILNVYKPRGITSFDVIHKLRKILNIEKIGHTGTLDPDADGVLLICVGLATKFIQYMDVNTKCYHAELTLGVETDTQDSSGKIINTGSVNVSSADIHECFKHFEGEYMQMPPMYSAVKIHGQKLYNLARKGITVSRAPKKVSIHRINIINIHIPKVEFEVCCSKGTYVRTLCHDIGKRLGCGGHLSSLTRTSVEKFDLHNSLKMHEISEMANCGNVKDVIIPVDSALENLKSVQLDQCDKSNFIKHIPVKLAEDSKEPKYVKIYDVNGIFLGVGEISTSYLKAKKLWRPNLESC